MRELSTPVLQLRDRLLILPIIGVLDSARARQLTEQLLGAIRDNRATVVVIDITGVATIDRTVANHLVQTVEASRLMGARTILTGLSSEIAQTLVDLDVDLGMMQTVGDLQGGLEEAERLAGYRRRRRRGRERRRRELRRAPMSVAILRQGDYLIASIQSDLSDSEVLELRHELAEMVGRHRSRGIVIDVAALDVIDSFVARALRSIVLTARMRGADTVIIGIQPDVAIAMVQFRLNLEPLRVALDLDAAMALLDRLTQGDADGWRMRSASPSPTDADLVTARAEGRAMAERLGLPATGSDADRNGDLRGRAQHRRARRPWRDRPQALRGRQPLWRRRDRDRRRTRHP